MYEFGVAAALLERVSLFAEQHDPMRVSTIGICLGELSDIDPHALSFGFEALAKDTPLAGARLHFEQSANAHRHADEDLDVSYVELEEATCL